MTGYSALVVEDNDVNFELFEFLLDELSIDVSRAASGQQALDLIQKHQPHILVLDIQLPGLDGLAVARALRAGPDTGDMLIMAVSALAMPGDREGALAAGCDRYVSKPIAPDGFQQAVRDLLNERFARPVL